VIPPGYRCAGCFTIEVDCIFEKAIHIRNHIDILCASSAAASVRMVGQSCRHCYFQLIMGLFALGSLYQAADL